MNKAKKLVVKATLIMDSISYFFLVPLAIYIIFFNGHLYGHKLKYAITGLIIVLVISVIHSFIFRYINLYKPLKKIYANEGLDPTECHHIKLALLNFPLRQAYLSTFIWIYGIAFLLLYIQFFEPLSLNVYFIGFAALCQSFLINFINNYFVAERIVSEVLELPMLSKILIEHHEYRPFSILRKTVITIVGLSLEIFIVISFLMFEALSGKINRDNIALHYTFIVIMILVVLVLTIHMYHYSTKKNIVKITQSIEKMSKGDLVTDLSMISIDELGILCTDLHHFNKSLKEITKLIYTEVENLYKNSETLKIDDNYNMNKEAMEGILGKYELDNLFEVTDALHQISHFMKEMIDSIGVENYIKNGELLINQVIQKSNTSTKLSNELLKCLVNYVKGKVGAVYSVNEQTLTLEGRYAYTSYLKESVTFGEGLIGQAAKDQELVIIDQIPNEDLLVMDLGIVQYRPKSVVIIPCVYNHVTSAVLTLGTMENFTKSQIELFKKIGSSIALAINSVRTNEENEKLLKQTQLLAQELKEQHDELLETNAEMEQINEELEQQTYELRKSEAAQEAQQNDLLEANEELNKINNELIVVQEQLKLKADNLERAYKYKSEFLANMSHELRTPLNSIIILSKILNSNKNNHLENKEVEFLETIFKSANDLLDLINEILDLAKVEAGMMEVNIEPIDTHLFIEDMKRNFSELAVNKGLDFNVKIDKNVPHFIKSDSQRLKQIMKNLLSNAFKFTHQGSIELYVYRPIQSKMIAFSVIDSGIGIAEKDQELIFKEFTQADGNINRKYGGTGLGLSISDKLATLLGGEIQVNSKVNEGSTFTLLIPDLDDQTLNKSAHKNNNTSLKPNKEDKVVLTICDVGNEEKLNQILGSLKAPYVNVKHLIEAEELLKTEPIKIIIIDGSLPIEAINEFLLKNKQESQSVILYSKKSITQDDEELLRKYVDSIIVKEGNSEKRLIDECRLFLNQTKETNKKPTYETNVFKSSHEILKDKKILIVDDDMRNVFALSSIFESNQLKVVVGKNGIEGLKQLNEHQDINLVLMDVMMPEMDGYQTMREIRHNPKYQSIPIIALTAKAMKDDRQKCLEAGANDYMSKPVDVDKLLSLIKVWLQK